MNYINNPKYLFGIKALLQRDIVLMLTKTHEQILFMKTAGDTPTRLPEVSKIIKYSHGKILLAE